MTNPDNIVRVRARNGGRASVYEANGWCQAFSTGLLEGNGVIQNTVADMNVLVGGSITKPDVVIATNPAGYKIALDIVGQQAVAITAPASNKRISAIVAYTDDLSLPTTQDTVTGAPGSCGLIVVNGTAASSPTAPNDTTIRSAITADGATGSQASYCVIATILVENGTTAITSSEITTNKAGVTSQNIDCATYSTSQEVACGTWVDGKTIYKKTLNFGTLPNNTNKVFPHGISNIDYIVGWDGIAKRSTDGVFFQIGSASNPQVGMQTSISIAVSAVSIDLYTGNDRTDMTAYITLYYTKF